MKKRHTYLKRRYIFGILFFMLVFMFWPHFQGVSLANSGADYDITVIDRSSGETVSIGEKTFVMRSKTQVLQLSCATDADFESVTWSVASGTEIVEIAGSKDTEVCPINAKKPGIATVIATVTYKDDRDRTRTWTIKTDINVRFSILEDAASGFQTVIPTDERDSLVIRDIGKNHSATGTGTGTGSSTILADGSVKLSLNYGEATDTRCTWTSADEDVCTVSGGTVTPVGAGKTTINASYLPADSTTVLKDTITVYVVPTVKLNPEDTSNTINVHSDADDDRLTTDTTYKENGGSIKDKVEWVISTGVEGATTIIEDSLGNYSSDLIELHPSTPNKLLKVVGKAGKYSVKFFPKGLYSGYVKAGLSIDDIPQAFYYAVNLNIYGEFADKTLYVNVGDSFDIAQAFNLTKEAFREMFKATLKSENVVTYTDSDFTGKADQIGDAIFEIVPNDVSLVTTLLDPKYLEAGTNYTLKVHVANGIALDRSSVTIALGASLQLRETSGAKDGEFKWSTSNATKVSCDRSGLIKGLQVTGDNQDVTITLTQTTSTGYIRRAVCKVRVVSTVTNIKLKDSRINLEVDKVTTIKATFTPDISTAPIMWITNEDEIVELSPSSDHKSVVVTGLKPGVAVISAVNTDNFVTASVTVTVVAPIKKIQLNATDLKVKLNQEVVKLKATYTPTDATSNTLIWKSSDTSIAKVDEDGVVTLLKAGSVDIAVSPEYNPYLTSATCTITILQSATGFSLNTTSLTMESGDTALIEYTMVPKSATSSISWKSMSTDIATVSDKGRVTAKSPGKTYIVAATDNGYSSTCQVVVTKAATGLTLDVYNLKLAVGDTYQVTAAPNPKNSTEKTFTWKSKDNSIATVNGSGKITGVKPGETVITVKTKSGSVEYLYVTVYNPATSMKLNLNKKTLVKGKKFTLKAIFTPSSTSNKKVTWTSSNKKIASVTSKGVVSGLRGGSVVITAVSQDGGYHDSCLVKVKQPVTSITLNKSSYTLGIGKSIKLTAKVKSNYATNQKLKWTSTNVKIASVTSKGVVKGKKLGTVTIKCKATDGSGEYATCKIRVVRQATKIKLNKTTIKMLVGHTTKIKAKVYPTNATYHSVKWSTSDKEVANVDSNGNIMAIGVGSCKIYAKAKDNSGKRATCFIYVSKAVPATGVTISQKDMTLVKGTSAMLSFSIAPNNTTDKVRFYSDNKRVATVSSTGRVSARKPGAATITIKTSSGKVGMVNVTVVGLNRSSISMGQYEREELWVEEISNGVRWYSENPSIATVTNGSVVSRKRGSTRIVAIINGIRLYCRIGVR